MRHVVLDTGFGHGERLAAARAAGAPLHYIAVLATLPPAQAIADETLRAAWPTAVAGLHRLLLDAGRTTLDILLGDVEANLGEVTARVDEFIVPAPLASPRVLGKLAVPDARLAACDGDDAWRRGLRAAGFSWGDDGTAPGWLEARYTSRKPQPPRPAPPERSAIVIGAGVAGSAACERLCARGWQVTLLERHAEPATEASGNRAGIFMPLLSRDDNIPTRLTRAAYLYALRHWQRLGGLSPTGALMLGEQCGVLQLARDGEHAALQREVVEQWGYPEAFVRWLDAGAATSLLGAATPYGAWLFGQGGWANPASTCRAMLAACGDRLRRVFRAEAVRLERRDGLWHAVGPDGAVLASAVHAIVANGAGALTLAQTATLPLYTMRGQVTHVAAPDFTALPLVVCREAYMTPPVDGIVSVGATYDKDAERTLRAASQEENLARAREILGPARVPDSLPLQGRVGLRCMAPDRLPLVGALPDYAAPGRPERLRDVARLPNLHGLLGYASRGLIWAPLAAELLACMLEDEPLPLEAGLAAALDPARFLLKERKRLATGSVASAP
ncbi:FAD-dependent 5-carboxymethylaminomethyl-2-thiouridine(34) oxidoreductase MnmC [Pseudoduganella chitinolytica]|uniref:FAD-dependent 5-carboxymethylaminomethyl-2-thiouridine(34) oxidoreductase MnmC n=1 Tax=Pseudoduganella chitinolytica TaxID=34070 RepID=A0ABY8BAA0_9BURK|nr:FAD-dependent 5-carboxymethylaminomethyl-2-thiouridine(34) oxidoreductase MnmC [Pseudoduganella chitinolytica]WEF32636.1 FAD-dependent 5-carboxymethylaminomethyl-2-thiouridine(34) oxidoreductase MnmC [Pseudoduganella chitinolytica]